LLATLFGGIINLYIQIIKDSFFMQAFFLSAAKLFIRLIYSIGCSHGDYDNCHDIMSALA